MDKGNALRRLKKVVVFLQTGWSIAGITLIVLILTETGFRAIFALRDRLSAETLPDRRVLAEGYDGATWPIDHYRELESLEDRWRPYVYFRQKPFQGKTITIGSDGLRATWEPPSPAPPDDQRPRVRLLMLGGSSLWGFGARDDGTIPSLLARNLDQRGWHVELRNLSEIGYVNTQELIALFRELQAGYRPDVVIFYDGVNDTTSAVLEGEAGLTTNEVNRRTEFNLLQSPTRLTSALISKLVKDSGSYRFAQAVRRRSSGEGSASRTSAADEIRSLAASVVQRYLANIAIAEKLGHSFGFRPLFYWQPVVFDKPVMVPFEREEAQKYAALEGIFRDVYGKVRDSAELEADPAFRDLSGLFSDSPNLIFIDYCHTTESANSRVAAEMAVGVIDALRGLQLDNRKPGGDRGGSSFGGVK